MQNHAIDTEKLKPHNLDYLKSIAIKKIATKFWYMHKLFLKMIIHGD